MLTNSPLAAVIPCVDLARARRFYGETLGLSPIDFPVPDGAEQPQDTGVLYRCGQDAMLLVYVRDTPTQADHTVAGWLVSAFDHVVDGLLERGVRFEVYTDMPGTTWDERGVGTSPSGSRGAWFKDPEGNILSLTESPQ